MASSVLVPSAMDASAAPLFDNASMWHNFTAWTAQHLTFLNMTRLTPSLDDIVWAGPRMVMKLGGLGGLGVGQRTMAEATDGTGSTIFQEITTMASAASFAATTVGGVGRSASGAAAGAMAGAGAVSGAAGAAAAAAAAAVADQDLGTALSTSASRFSFESARGLGSLFRYVTSKWALCCIASAVVLNRTYIFAATRRRVRLRWPVRLALRGIPVLLLFAQACWLLQAIQCQTSPDFSQLRWGNASKHSDLMFAQKSPFLHALSSKLLLGASDAASCRAVRMVPSDDSQGSVADLRGSLSLLWPLFLTFCLSHFIETLACAVQGRPVAAETGMTVFEHSLAFAEADAAISNQLGWGTFSAPSTSVGASSTLAAAAARASSSSGSSSGDAAMAITRSMIMARVNTPPEVLLLAFLSTMSHITSHVLGMLNLQSRFRLVNTSFWALCFMGSIVWSALTFSLDDPAGQSLLRFPTVSIVSFIPHMLVLLGIFICCAIYGLALLLSAASQESPDSLTSDGGEPLSFRERLASAHANMQANLPMGHIRISMDMDFYTALLRAGIDAITMASEAVYLNEDRRVNLRPHTWLEEERYDELQQMRSKWLGVDLSGSRFDAVGATGLVPVTGGSGRSRGSNGKGFPAATTGYSRERAAQQKPGGGKASERIRPVRAGVGATERSGRWVMAVEYLLHVGKLVLSFTAVYICRGLAWVGMTNPPRWLQRWAQRRKAGGRRGASDDNEADSDLGGDGLGDDLGLGGGGGYSGGGGWEVELGSEWLVDGQESFAIRRGKDVDVEHEIRRRFARGRDDSGGGVRDRDLDRNLDRNLDRSRLARREEREIDSQLYQWWLKGGWWGEVDTSGDYEPSRDADGDEDDDTTSVISAAEDGDTSESGWESAEDDEGEDDGQRTPTQESSWASRKGSPAAAVQECLPLALPDLVRLLDPHSPAERDEAQALAAHLNSEGVLTRSAFARFRQRQRAELLATSRYGPGRRRLADFRPGVRLTPDEEAELLEQILLSRRGGAEVSASASSSWATGAAGLGPDGPQCVVCQSAPRTIIVWPCRCLSLCDDCRVSLAMNNFDKCVCCRREVVSFSRIYVP